MLCKCGNPSKGTDLVQRYIKKDGTESVYVKKEKRCQKCINITTMKAKRKAYKSITKESFIGY